MTKKVMKMKRANGEPVGHDGAEVVSADDKQVQQPTVSGSGAIIMMPKEEEVVPVAEIASKPNKKASVSKRGEVFTVNAPDEEMEEVSFDDFEKKQKSALTEATTAKSATEMVQNLVGKNATAAKAILEDLIAKKFVSSFRLIPIGQPMTMDVVPGRVQVLIDAAKRVIDVQIS